jgi:hypothetical protein
MEIIQARRGILLFFGMPKGSDIVGETGGPGRRPELPGSTSTSLVTAAPNRIFRTIRKAPGQGTKRSC